jgi:hypothetical protein
MAKKPKVQEYMTRKEAAEYLTSLGCPVSPNTLANKAANNNQGRGPEFIASGWKTVRYARAALDKWAKTRVWYKKTALDKWAADKVVPFIPPVSPTSK